MAATTTRSSNDPSHINSRMSSPKAFKNNTLLKNEDSQRKDTPSDGRQPSPPRIEQPAAGAPSDDGPVDSNSKNVPATAPSSNANVQQPLGPPPRPSQNPTTTETPDYFNTVHNTSYHLAEPNPFEQSFGNPAAETPGKLPPVASLTSPSSLLPGGTPGWANSLRSGPLSPAMLTGPAGTSDYFGGPDFRGGFPTPNESSLRTGLTPGGTGSMFPAPSPNSQALFNSLGNGGATPGTLDFQRTALNAAAVARPTGFNIPTSSAPTSQPAEPAGTSNMDHKFQPHPPPPSGQPDPYGQHDTHDAANGLYMLAQNGVRSNGQFAIPGQPAHALNAAFSPMQGQPGTQSQEASPVANRTAKNSVASVSGSADTGDFSDSGQSEQAKPTTRSRGKKAANSKSQPSGNRRKADEPAAKGPASKKSKNSGGSVNDGDSDDDAKPKQEQELKDTKKMTDEEKRKNFLERNRVAALKCRQRKKQWLANLQAKVEIFSTENDHLSAQVTQLREEIVNLKTLLMAHKDCPVSQAQGLGGMAMDAFLGGPNQHTNPYGMAMQPNGVQGMPPMPMPGQAPGQGMQRR